MSKPDDRAAGASAAQAGSEGERRSNDVLRKLVSEMLERVRELSRRTADWTSAERAQAESELEAIMASVRREAARSHSEDK